MEKPVIIAVVGGKSSGKTTTMEALIRELTKRGYKVAAVKHIPEKDFTIDQREKDTWRFAQSGAKTIISVAANEVATIEKTNPKDFSLEKILQKCREDDVILLEGFRKLVSGKKGISKIVAVKSADEAAEALKRFEPILAFTGPYSAKKMRLAIPYIDVLRNPEKIANLAEKVIDKKVESA